MKRSWSWVSAATVVALACGPVHPAVVDSAPQNACPAHPCTSYLQTDPLECVGGACVVSSVPPPATSDLVLVISVPDDAYAACTATTCTLVPGQAFPIAYDALVSESTDAGTSAPPADASSTIVDEDASPAIPTAAIPVVELPVATEISGLYTVTPKTGGTDLGNPGEETSLPIQATLRWLWPANGGLVEATLLGLPVPPIQAQLQQSVGTRGPNGGEQTLYETFLPPGTFERTLSPVPPFDATFGPVTEDIDPFKLGTFDRGLIDGYDVTGGNALPTFDISRADGLDGWTAYLRDTTTGRAISDLVPLAGTDTQAVFAVKRIPLDGQGSDPDALSGANLVVAPPAGSPISTGVFTVFNNSPIIYPALPPPVTITGRVSFAGDGAGADGAPVQAQVVFESTSISGAASMSDIPNFEFTASVETQTAASLDGSTGVEDGDAPMTDASPDEGVDAADAAASGTRSTTLSSGTVSTYTVTVPQGSYRVSVRPLSPSIAADGTRPALLITGPLVASQDANVDFVLQPSQSRTGQVKVKDGRLLSQAIVDALPLACAGPAGPASTFCLPRPVQQVTDDSGRYAFVDLDPGSYTLRVRPVDGTRLPWVIAPQPLVVNAATGMSSSSSSSVPVPPILVPAPLSVGLTLHDFADNAIPGALVRMFRLAPAPGGSLPQAVEVGQGWTGADGSYAMYVAPASP